MAILMKSAVSAPVPTVPSELQDRIITVIIPYTPGGDTDATQRFVVEQVSRISGLKFVIVNKGGASGIVGTREFIKARPDGLTIMGHANETFALNPILFKEQAVNMREYSRWLYTHLLRNLYTPDLTIQFRTTTI